jgi:hypothetical protein
MEEREDIRFQLLRQTSSISIGIIERREEFGTRKEVIDLGPKPDLGPEPVVRYYPNSIEEYRYLLFVSNKTRNRKGLGQKKKSAEGCIKFLQYVKTQKEFMEILERQDPTLLERIYVYSDPMILKTPFKQKRPIPPKEKT